MNYNIAPSHEAWTADLRTVTATFAGKKYQIDPTPWGTVFKHNLYITKNFPWGPIDGYVEHPVSDSEEDKAKLLPARISMVQIKQSDVVPSQAKLIRVHDDKEIWMLYFPPKTCNAIEEAKEKEAALGKAAALKRRLNEATASGSSGPPEGFSDWASFDEAYFAAYAEDLGYGVTADDVRVHFANEICDEAHRLRNPDNDDAAWEAAWNVFTRNGTLEGTHSKHWKDKKTEPVPRSKVDEARLRRQEASNQARTDSLFTALAEGMGDTTSDELRIKFAKHMAKERKKGTLGPHMTEGKWDQMWRELTRDGTLGGVPKKWEDVDVDMEED